MSNNQAVHRFSEEPEGAFPSRGQREFGRSGRHLFNHEVDRTRGDESTMRVLHLQREEDKNREDDTEALALLRQAGFTATEVDRLRRLRKHYAKQEGGT